MRSWKLFEHPLPNPETGEYYNERDGYQLKESVEDISECNLVMCNSGNLILKGYDKSKSEWKLMWAINYRDVNDC